MKEELFLEHGNNCIDEPDYITVIELYRQYYITKYGIESIGVCLFILKSLIYSYFDIICNNICPEIVVERISNGMNTNNLYKSICTHFDINKVDFRAWKERLAFIKQFVQQDNATDTDLQTMLKKSKTQLYIASDELKQDYKTLLSCHLENDQLKNLIKSNVDDLYRLLDLVAIVEENKYNISSYIHGLIPFNDQRYNATHTLLVKIDSFTTRFDMFLIAYVNILYHQYNIDVTNTRF